MDPKIARKIPLDKELPNAAGDPSRIPLPALMELAVDAMWTDFRASLLEAGITDIRPTHGCVFRFLHGDGMRLTELASLAGLTKQSVGEIVDDLTALGYIERYPDPTDKRAKLLRLTKKGKAAQAVGFGLFSKLEEEWATTFGDDDIALLRALLERVALAKAPGAVPEIVRPDPALVP
jgi:DNA-binding MarR family transcriptional regulator